MLEFLADYKLMILSVIMVLLVIIIVNWAKFENSFHSEGFHAFQNTVRYDTVSDSTTHRGYNRE